MTTKFHPFPSIYVEVSVYLYIPTYSNNETVETTRPEVNATPTLRYENNQSDLTTLKTEETVPFREKGPAESHPGTHGSEGYSHKEGFNMVLII